MAEINRVERQWRIYLIDDYARGDCWSWLPFSVESVNLQYEIPVRLRAKVSDLALLVRDRILRPLEEYDDNRDWANAQQVALALRSDPKKPFDPELSLHELIELLRTPQHDHHALIARIPKTVVPAPYRTPNRGVGPWPLRISLLVLTAIAAGCTGWLLTMDWGTAFVVAALSIVPVCAMWILKIRWEAPIVKWLSDWWKATHNT